MSFLDFLLAGDKSGELQAIADDQAADLAAGKRWGVFLDGEMVEGPCSARFLAEFARHDCADAQDRDETDYEIKEIP